MKPSPIPEEAHYASLVTGLGLLLDAARRASARAVNYVMTATYWEFGRRIVEFEQHGQKRAGYGEELLVKLSADLTGSFGRGFGVDNLELFRTFYLTYPGNPLPSVPENSESPIRNLADSAPGTPIPESLIRRLPVEQLAARFPLTWTHYVQLIRRVRTPEARTFYEMEALRGGWSVRQLARQISSLFYERTAFSRDKGAVLSTGAKTRPEDRLTAEEEVKDPLVLEFLNLKDEYSESELEEALLLHLEQFLLELGDDFTFVGRQRRLRIGDEWYRVDLLFFHRRLRCLVVIDLKIGRFAHADAGQMHTYLNYAQKHWMREGENTPVGLILCSEANDALAQYALEGLSNKVLAREYSLALPKPKLLTEELAKTRRQLEARRIVERGN